MGVVERRHSPAEGLPGSSEERLELLEAEDTVGNAIALATTLVENMCTWWIGTLRERMLVRRTGSMLKQPLLTLADISLSPWPFL